MLSDTSLNSSGDFTAQFLASILEFPQPLQEVNESIATHFAKRFDLWFNELEEIATTNNNLVAYLSINLCNIAVEAIQTSVITITTGPVQDTALTTNDLLNGQAFQSSQLKLKWTLAMCSQWSETIRSLYRFSLETDSYLDPNLGANDNHSNDNGNGNGNGNDGRIGDVNGTVATLSNSTVDGGPHSSSDWTHDPNSTPEAILCRVGAALNTVQALDKATRRALISEAEEGAIEDILVNCSYMFSSEQRATLLSYAQGFRSVAPEDAAVKSDCSSEMDTTVSKSI
jgi:hypothetical protein